MLDKDWLQGRALLLLLLALSPLPAIAQAPAAPAAEQAAPPAPGVPPPLAVPRTSGEIVLDGALDEAAWQGAALIDTFFETFPADNTEPPVKTVAYVTYDATHFYVGIHAFDPAPERIRAPYVERDNVLGTDDNVAVFLDTRNDRQSAVELRVNPRGNQGDASYNDATGNEDFSPDFFYDTAARITADGWTAEMRIPFSSLRYPEMPENRWGILVWRNYPRDQRYMLHSSPIPRGSNCWICQSRELTGLTGLPGGGRLVMAPYVTGQQVGAPRAGLGTSIQDDDPEADAGIDVKWTPSASNALDLTLNPDFSQVETDAGQIAVNNQFALFFPEKRPFFLEGVDLFDSPFQAVYTRTINDPRWGARDTGKLGPNTYTVLVTEDEGGGSVIVPGPTGSQLVRQDFSSHVLVGRLRRDFGLSFGGLVVTAREIDGGGHNRVIGPDMLWRRSDADQVSVQLLYSDTETPDRRDLFSGWDGRKLTGHAAHVEWLHTTERWTWRATLRDVDEDFRNDQGFLTQVDYRRARGFLGYGFYPENPWFRRVQTYVVSRRDENRDGDLLSQVNVAGIGLSGRNNLAVTFEVIPGEQQRVGAELLERDYVFLFAQIDPGRRFSRIGIDGTVGEHYDFAHARVGDGADLTLFGVIKPTDHLALEPSLSRRWLDVDAATGSGRLFTAEIERLKATYNFSARAFLRLIGEYVSTELDPALHAFPVDREEAFFTGTALFAYQVNWQTVLYVGYGDDRVQDLGGDLQPAGRAVFVKLSYAFQR
jgi:hypothetical protein